MKILLDNSGKAIVTSAGAMAVPGISPDIELPKYTGHVDTEGLTALGWDSEDIAWLQEHVWWDEEDDDYWAVTEANLAFGPNGATPLTWANRASIKTNPDVRYFPKFDPSPSSNTRWDGLFSDYIYLYAIPTHGWDTSYVTNMANLFLNCHSLFSVGELSSWNTQKVNLFASMFQSCFSLIDVGNLSLWNTSSVTNMGRMFNNCYCLRNIGDISNWAVSNCTSLANMFSNCCSLLAIGDLSNWDTSSVTAMNSVFTNCYLISSLGNLSSWDVSKVQNTSNMFGNCYNLMYVGDLSGWDMSSNTMCSAMFASCYKLQSIGDISQWDLSSVTNMNSMFQYAYELDDLGDFSRWDTSNNTSLSYFMGSLIRLTTLDASDFDISKTLDISRCFWRCYNLTDLDLTNWDTSAVTNVGTSGSLSAFSECYSLRTLKLGPKFFNFSPSKIYINQCEFWTRDSIYESLYTNQTLRDSNSPAKTVALAPSAYDSLSVQDREDIATKNITLTRE